MIFSEKLSESFEGGLVMVVGVIVEFVCAFEPILKSSLTHLQIKITNQISKIINLF
jgi:hypothetical protein